MDKNPDDLTASALERWRRILPTHAPELWHSLRPPASEEDLEQLRRAIDPWPLPASVETWLRFADGSAGRRFLVVDNCPLPARQIAESYRQLLEFQPPGLLPISYESHVQSSVELQGERTQVVIDTTVSSVEWRVVAPSFPALLHAVADLAEEGYLRDGYPPRGIDLRSPDAQRRMNLIRDRWRASLAEYDWSDSPFPQEEWFNRDDGPAAWGPFPREPWVGLSRPVGES